VTVRKTKTQLLDFKVKFSYRPTSDEVLRLAYNPTYDLWFFVPSGRPRNLTNNIKDAYNERRPGGVCFQPEDNIWFYCASGENIQ
ncbi:hypothetical protein KR093_004038, partial [Drosophila rubida]